MVTSGRPFEMSGPWLKGNLHLHTYRSDGILSPEAVAKIYADADYDFIAITDHWKTFISNGDRQPLVILNGVELDGHDAEGSYFHVLVVGLQHPIPGGKPLPEAIAMAREQGAVVIWAHPYWTGNSVTEAARHDFDGMEIYNHGCQCEIGKGYALTHWDAILESKPGFVGIAVDDAHFRSESMFWGGGWVMVNAENRAPETILGAIRQGRFYASQGPSFESIAVADDRIEIAMSPVRFARLVGPREKGVWLHEPHDFSEAAFQLPRAWDYVRIEIEDVEKSRAWTNPIPLPR